jgi:hypothetical protein
MKTLRRRRTYSTLTLLLGLSGASCMMAGGGDGSGQAEPNAVASEEQPFNSGPETTASPIKGHDEITKKAMLYLAQHNLLPSTLFSAANQALVVYGDDFADHPWMGRPEAPTTAVPTVMTSARGTFSSGSGNFQFDIPVDYWDEPTETTTAKTRLNWLPGGKDWQPAGSVDPFMVNTTLHYQTDLEVYVDVFWDSVTTLFGKPGDSDTKVSKDFDVDNLLHYALGDVKDYGVSGLAADATTLKLYPFLPEHCASQTMPVSSWGTNEWNVARGVANGLNNQPLLQGADFGADKYGAILYQLARKFFVGSAVEPQLSDLVKAGNSVYGWHTGSMQGISGLSSVKMTFPHTYLGGNPNICAGGNSTTDPCATGSPTWPVWVPATAPTTSTLSTMQVSKPGRSDRSALVYLGWAAHMMQDLAAPHHASNWSGMEHEQQDGLGDTPAFYQRVAGQEQYLMDSYAQADVDALLGSISAPKSRAAICSSLGVTDSQLVAGSNNWSSVRPLFLSQAKTAFGLRKASGATIDDGAQYVKNAILGTMKLLLCATPSSTPTVGYQNTTGASGFVWAGSTSGSGQASSSYSYNSTGSTVANTISWLGTGYARVDFPGLGDQIGGNVQVTAYGGSTDRCKVGGWGSSGSTLQAWVYCHNTAGQLVNTPFTASYVRRTGVGYNQTGGYVWADQPSAASYTPSPYYQYNAAGQRNTISRSGVGQYYVTFPGTTVNGGSVEVTAYGSGSEYCKIGYWSGNGVAVNCFANGGAPVDSLFTLNFTDQSPNGTPSYQYAWADQPTATNYTPSTYYQKGMIARECDTSAGTVTINRNGTGNYTAILPVLSPTGSNVKVTSYSGGAEMCKVVGWYGNGSSGTQVNIACYSPTGAPADTYFDLVYSSNQWIIC